MKDKNAQLIEALTLAMDAEKKAAKFYRDSASKVSADRGKILLRQLADFEDNHFEKLGELRDSLGGGGGYITYEGTKLGSITGEIPYEDGSPSERNLEDVLGILSLAMDAETGAHKRYMELAGKIGDRRGRDMFIRLADEEMLHRRILADEYYHLNNKGGVWSWGD